jgi:predicted transcriptional regulator
MVIIVLWEQGRCSIRQIAESVYPDGGASQYATVQKLLERLEQKQFVSCDRKPWPHQFAAALSRDQLIGRRLQAMADLLCEGSVVPLLSNLLKAKLNPQHVSQLRELVEEMEKSKGR